MRRTLSRTALALCLLFPAVRPAQAQTAEARLEEAIRQELVLGELDRAITLYRDILTRFPGQRGVAARALANLGRAYEKLGSKEAQAAYQRVVRDFADQAEPVQFARGRLQALRAGETGTARAVTAGGLALLFAELPILRIRDNPQFDFSPDGERMVFRTDHASDSLAGVALAIANSEGTIVRTLLPPVRQMGRVSPRWSPDGKYIAFIQRSFVEADTVFGALMVVPAEGGPARIVTTELNARRNPARGGLFWTPDGRGITVVTPPGLVTFDLDGKVLRTVTLPVPLRRQFIGYSPDGRWLAYHDVNAGAQENDRTDIWIMPSTGGNAQQVTRDPGFDGWPSWSADGRALYYVSDRGGSSNLWKLNFDSETGLAKGEPAALTSYTDATVLYPRAVAGGRKLAFALVRETGTIHVGPADAPDQSRVVARGNDALLSPDGRTLYYLGQGSGRPGIFAMPVEGGTQRRLTDTPPNRDSFQRFRLSPDGSALAYFSRSGEDNALFVVGSSGGAPRQLIRFPSSEILVPSWSPDGTRLAYSHGDGLYTIAATSGQPVKLATLLGWEGWTVRWSPDGEHIAAFGYAAANQTNAIYVVPARGGELRRLTPPEERWYKEGLEWHPDGRRLSYMYYGRDDRGDGSRLAYLDGSPTSLLVDQPSPLWDYTGVWSPNGRHYYFTVSDVSRSWEVYVHDIQSNITRLALARGTAEPGVGKPSFSRDGRVMAWTVERTTRQVWAIDLSP